uniref:asparagine synthase (glutamine-hydrolyzing) n=1 Tax=Marseillevirus LCMAC201 TaxID=2506605 RepID=A0A481YWQ0_9VIRU|nr:MAG: asparagine synthase [Marseillevirus LCMAC201]
MCGIFAYIQRGEFSTGDLQMIKKYFFRIKHRGPDYTSSVILTKFNCSIFLGFHRLAIIGKTNSLLVDGDTHLVCNGEIYNYKHLITKYRLPVKTDSDCEVILQLYQHHPQLWPDVLEELDGVFAFVLYDNVRGRFFISRDRIGVRPLFEGNTQNTLAFASEGKAIPLVTAKPHLPGVLHDLTLRNEGWEVSQSIWVKPGNYLNVPYMIAQNIIRELFTNAVRKRLISDRPIGFLVSGGLDSSLVAAVAHRLLGKQITTFSIGLPESPDLLAARKVAAYLQSDHHEVIISTDDILEALPNVIYHDETYDITTIRASIPMYLISKYISENTDIKVIFSGEGADELLGGYLYFHKAPTCDAFQNETIRLMQELYKYDVLRGDRTTSAWGLEIRVPFLDADFISFVSNIDPSHKMPKRCTLDASPRSAKLFERAAEPLVPKPAFSETEAFPESGSKQASSASRIEPKARSPEGSHSEKQSFSFVENPKDFREPRNEIEKAILRHAFDGYLPNDILYRQKEAFSDGIGYNSVASLKQLAAENKNRCLNLIPNTAHPVTDEAHLYYYLFRKHYSDRPGLHTMYYWMPMWHQNITDPSATVLETHSVNK